MIAASLSTFGGFLEGRSRHERRCLEGGTGDTLKNLLGSGRLSIANLDRTEVTALERRVFVAELAGSDDLAGLDVLAVACVGDNLLAPDAVVLVHEVALVDHLLLEEAGVAQDRGC